MPQLPQNEKQSLLSTHNEEGEDLASHSNNIQKLASKIVYSYQSTHTINPELIKLLQSELLIISNRHNNLETAAKKLQFQLTNIQKKKESFVPQSFVQSLNNLNHSIEKEVIMQTIDSSSTFNKLTIQDKKQLCEHLTDSKSYFDLMTREQRNAAYEPTEDTSLRPVDNLEDLSLAIYYPKQFDNNALKDAAHILGILKNDLTTPIQHLPDIQNKGYKRLNQRLSGSNIQDLQEDIDIAKRNSASAALSHIFHPTITKVATAAAVSIASGGVLAPAALLGVAINTGIEANKHGELQKLQKEYL